jgi:three-Cys-motif partner protein
MSAARLDLRPHKHPKCGGKNCPERDNVDADGLCTHTMSATDGFPLRCVGDWAAEKIYWLVRYFGIFTGSMFPLWRGNLNYVEICSGPGRCIAREAREEIDGTSLAIASSPGFQKLRAALFIDNNQKVVDTLNHRLSARGATKKAKAVIGDYTDLPGMANLLASLPQGCLNLVFIDPTDCSVPFSTVRKIAATLKSVDYIINVALGTDANRNLAKAILHPTHTTSRHKYESFLGAPGFCSRPETIAKAKLKDSDDLRRLFRDQYRASLKQEGFIYSDPISVEHYYYLLFASRHQTGYDLWQKIQTVDPAGQRTLSLPGLE